MRGGDHCGRRIGGWRVAAIVSASAGSKDLRTDRWGHRPRPSSSRSLTIPKPRPYGGSDDRRADEERDHRRERAEPAGGHSHHRRSCERRSAEDLLNRSPTRERRFRIEQAQHLNPDVIKRFAADRVVASMQPITASATATLFSRQRRRGMQRTKLMIVRRNYITGNRVARRTRSKSWPSRVSA